MGKYGNRAETAGHVQGGGEAELALIGKAGGFMCFLFAGGEGWQQEGSQNGHNRYDN